ncbi:MAG: 6-carboxy-5,6,7,8-tetrahydropterin synthase [Alphaproteobacteria bacterium MarineAlpha9_Bin4]|nr:6-carboxytetrahydropterin synthase QueD [Pelagibacterales bacterium]PPR27512.1 MAG: 6-carboxy-5,6,7,8-tetrahydropterin synthase [Alphaproteobacteria bacterium MarineAlpha9_Bin4]|tara:strand:- start:169 stop:525 length:357 start_codon:yes stop_codon:yes gene_type:complete
MNKLICKSFTFEAAHNLTTTTNDKNKNIHGHSFHVKIYIKGEVKKNGMIVDFFILDKTVKKLKDKLDHSYLNDIKEIKTPTLENIGSWIWKQIKPTLKNLYKVDVARKTCGESFSIFK